MNDLREAIEIIDGLLAHYAQPHDLSGTRCPRCYWHDRGLEIVNEFDRANGVQTMREAHAELEAQADDARRAWSVVERFAADWRSLTTAPLPGYYVQWVEQNVAGKL